MTFVLWVLVALLTKPDPEERLIEFYKRARPLGWWGPIAKKAGIQPRSALYIPSGLVVAAVGAIMVAAGTIAFSSAYVGNWPTVAVFAAICLVTGIIFKLTHKRFMNVLHAGQEQGE